MIQTLVKKNYLKLTKLFLFIFLFPIFFTSQVFAEEEAPIIPPIQISPLTRRVSLNPKEKITGTIEVKNYGNDPVALKVYAAPYSDEDDIRNFEKESVYTKISHWIKIKDGSGSYNDSYTFTIQPKETKNVSYMITTPENVTPGGQYASIFVETLLDDNKDITMSTRAGMLIYATINGDIHSESLIENIKTNSLISSDKLKVSYTVANKGNIDFQTSTSLQISSIFGRQLYTNTTISTILPESTKEIEEKWEDTPPFGFFLLHYKIRALDNIIDETRFVIIASPFILIIFFLLVVTAILAIAYRIKLRHKKEK